MHLIRMHFDVISPYALLAFDRLPQALEGLSVAVSYEPLLLAGLLGHWGQKGPAEIAPKRAWTYRQVAWLAQQQGTRLELPDPHPFNPLALQRLAVAAAPAGGTPNRRAVELLFRHVWCRAGADPNEPQALAALQAVLAPRRDPAGAEVKAELRVRTEAAAAAGVFGVPSFEVGGRSFFGQDALPMLRAFLSAGPGAQGALGDAEWDDAGRRPQGVQRRPA